MRSARASHRFGTYITRSVACLMLPVAVAMPPQGLRNPGDAQHSAQATPAPASSVCLDQVFFGPLPGKTNYCLGLRDWNKGEYRSGLQLLKLAAGWGNKNAEYTLGLIYYGGHHVPRNPALGIAWLKLADQRHNDPQVVLAARSATSWATHAQRQRGEQLYQQMLATYGDAVATARAWRHLQHWRRSGDARAHGCMYLVGQQASVAMAAGLAAPVFDPTNPDDKQFRVCMPLQTRQHVVRHTVDRYFQDWGGTVTVGPLRTIPAPATTSGP